MSGDDPGHPGAKRDISMPTGASRGQPPGHPEGNPREILRPRFVFYPQPVLKPQLEHV
jgi:hypothetical protein